MAILVQERSLNGKEKAIIYKKHKNALDVGINGILGVLINGSP